MGALREIGPHLSRLKPNNFPLPSSSSPKPFPNSSNPKAESNGTVDRNVVRVSKSEYPDFRAVSQKLKKYGVDWENLKAYLYDLGWELSKTIAPFEILKAAEEWKSVFLDRPESDFGEFAKAIDAFYSLPKIPTPEAIREELRKIFPKESREYAVYLPGHNPSLKIKEKLQMPFMKEFIGRIERRLTEKKQQINSISEDCTMNRIHPDFGLGYFFIRGYQDGLKMTIFEENGKRYRIVRRQFVSG